MCERALLPLQSLSHNLAATLQRHWFELWGPRNKRKERQRRPYDDLAQRGNRKWHLWPAERLLLCFPVRPLIEHRVSLRFLSQLMLGDIQKSHEKQHIESNLTRSPREVWVTLQPEKQHGCNPSTCMLLSLTHNHISKYSIYRILKVTKIMFVRKTDPQMRGTAPGGAYQGRPCRVTFLNKN